MGNFVACTTWETNIVIEERKPARKNPVGGISNELLIMNKKLVFKEMKKGTFSTTEVFDLAAIIFLSQEFVPT